MQTCKFCNRRQPSATLSSRNGKRCLAVRQSLLQSGLLAWNSVIDSPTLKMPLTGFCKWVFLIFPPLRSAPNPPTSQSFSFFLCFFGLFPTLGFIATPPPPPLSLLLHISLVYLCFSLHWTLPKPNSSDPCYLVLARAFPQEWTNRMINALSPFAAH